MDPVVSIMMLLSISFAIPFVSYLLFCLFKEPFGRGENALHTTPEMLHVTREVYRSRYGALEVV
jgi:hypothetical protein